MATRRRGTQITGTSDPDLFAAERYGHFTYAIPVDSRDRYTIVLHFAEFYFGLTASGVGGEAIESVEFCRSYRTLRTQSSRSENISSGEQTDMPNRTVLFLS